MRLQLPSNRLDCQQARYLQGTRDAAGVSREMKGGEGGGDAECRAATRSAVA